MISISRKGMNLKTLPRPLFLNHTQTFFSCSFLFELKSNYQFKQFFFISNLHVFSTKHLVSFITIHYQILYRRIQPNLFPLSTGSTLYSIFSLIAAVSHQSSFINIDFRSSHLIILIVSLEKLKQTFPVFLDTLFHNSTVPRFFQTYPEEIYTLLLSR